MSQPTRNNLRRKRQRSRKQNYQQRVRAKSNFDSNCTANKHEQIQSEIEAQLRLQRIEQHSRNSSELTTLPGQGPPAAVAVPASKRKMRLGRFEFDESRQTYFPIGSKNELPNGTKNNCGNSEIPLACRRTLPYQSLTGTSIPSVLLSHLINICANRSQRCRMVTQWAGQHLLESMRPLSTPESSRLSTLNGNNNMFRLIYGMEAARLDCQLKLNVPNWSRTFAFDTSNVDNKIPRCYTIFREGIAEAMPHSHSGHYRYHDYEAQVYAIRFSRYHSNFGILSNGRSEICSRFTFPLAEPIYVNSIIHDFCVDQKGTVWLGGERMRVTKKSSLWVIYPHAFVPTNLCLRKFPKSSILCVEPQENSTGFVTFLGHRSGQVSTYDSRTNSCCFTSHNQSEKTYSNVLNLHLLAQHQLLVRRNFGFCCLYDIRKVGSGDTIQSKSAIIHHFSLPSHQKIWTNRCSGVTTDPSETVAIAPFVDETYLPRLGLWSLYSGEFVGSRRIGVHDNMRNTESRRPIVELNANITSAWDWKSHDGLESIQKKAGCFGLWYKLVWTEDDMNSVIPVEGNIHHTFFEGRSR